MMAGQAKNSTEASVERRWGVPGAASMEAMRSLPFIAVVHAGPAVRLPQLRYKFPKGHVGGMLLVDFQLLHAVKLGNQDVVVVPRGRARGGQAHFHPSDLWNLLPQGQHPLPGLFQVFRLGLAAGGFLKLEHDDVLNHFYLPSLLPAVAVYLFIVAHLPAKNKGAGPGWKNFSRGHTAKFSHP